MIWRIVALPLKLVGKLADQWGSVPVPDYERRAASLQFYRTPDRTSVRRRKRA